MSIKATVLEIRQSYRALRRVNEEVRFPWEAAWDIGKVLNKLRPIVILFEEQQTKLFKDRGAVPSDQGLKLEDPIRRDGEPDDEFTRRSAR